MIAPTIKTYIGIALWMVGLYILGFWAAQAAFTWIALGFVSAFTGMWVCVTEVLANRLSLRFAMMIAIIGRVLLLFTWPTLSDDVFRFIWDGRLLAQGLDPFAQLPVYYTQAGQAVEGLELSLFEALNSPEYYTIYPPIPQLSFWWASSWFFHSLTGNMIFLKVLQLIGELVVVFLLPRALQRHGIAAEQSVWYLLNPLVVVETVGNLHHEGWVMAFLVLALYFWYSKEWWSAISLGLAIATKLLPILFLPMVVAWKGWKKAIGYGLLAMSVFGLLLWLVIGVEAMVNMSQSIDLYFRKFEFNASVYYLLRYLGFAWKGYNIIGVLGPCLALVAGGLILWLSWARSWKGSIAVAWMWCLTVYLMLSTTVHPWYIIPLIGLSTFGTWRFPIVWSAVIWLSYAAYSMEPFREMPALLWLSYGVVLGYGWWEYFKKQKKNSI